MNNPTSDLTLLSAHRGVWEVYPENSSLALQEAFNEGLETVEVDVRYTQDSQIVISHDYKLDRISNGSGYLFQTPYNTVAGLSLRDRHGNIYKTSGGKTLPFLTFSGALDLLDSNLTADGHGYVMIVDVKGPAGSSDPTNPMQLISDCIKEIASKGNSTLAAAVVFKFKDSFITKGVYAANGVTVSNRSTFEKATGIGSSGSNAIIVVSPEDSQLVAANYDPSKDTFLTDFLGASYLSQIELNHYYNGDGNQEYFTYVNAHGPTGTATYFESNFYPEGVATSAGSCCVAHITNPTITPPDSKTIVPDYRGDPEFSLLNPTNLVTTDEPNVVINLLKIKGKRNLARINY